MSVRRNVPHYVYRLYDAEGALIYIGCTNQPTQRVRGHQLNGTWGSQIDSVRFTVFPNRRKALDVERAAIWNEKPLHNVRRYPLTPLDGVRTRRESA